MDERTIGTNIAIIGGGLAGLTAATILARAGLKVALFEKGHELGGRAMTEAKSGFFFNRGPHALYLGGHAYRILHELGVQFQGHTPPTDGGYGIDGGINHTLPSGPFSLLTTRLLKLADKLEFARLMNSFGKLDARAARDLTVREWLEKEIFHPDTRRLVRAYFRLATYADAPDHQSAGDAIEQLQLAAASNVLYLDEGWQTLIHGLRVKAESAGVKIFTGTKVKGVERDLRSNGGMQGVRLSDGTIHSASFVMIAASPADACLLVADGEETSLNEWAKTAIPVKAACLDVALSYLPQPHVKFAIGIDRPLYYSVHSASARLAPTGSALIHMAKYLGSVNEDDPKGDERDLELMLDRLQPGWREAVVERRFLPKITVSHALTTAAQGGTSGRPGPAVPEVPGLYVAGDWVGKEGLLADASVASAKCAAEMILHAVQGQSAAA